MKYMKFAVWPHVNQSDPTIVLHLGLRVAEKVSFPQALLSYILVISYILQQNIPWCCGSSLLFVCIQSLWLADSDSLSLLIHAGGKLGALRECANFLMNPECLVEDFGSIPMWQMASWWVVEMFFPQLQHNSGKVVKRQVISWSFLFNSSWLLLGSLHLLLTFKFHLNNQVF